MYDCAMKGGFHILAYCVMPNHIHMLAEAGRETSDVQEFMRMFKQKTSYQYRHKSGTTLWQKGYYDHVLREDEDTVEVTKYILSNPVRKGFVEDFALYPWIGSEVFDVRVI
jgi:REP element-mobilizing transposase RayT